MKLVAKIVGGLVLVLVLVMAAQIIASESGEVVVLTTQNAEGQSEETRLWVVDYQGHAWLRAGGAGSGWFQRLLDHPDVQVSRDGQVRAFKAVPVSEMGVQINRLMLDKYGLADQFIGLMYGRENSAAIRLDPPAG